MKTAMKLALSAVALAAATLAPFATASAQDYPTRPITLVVPYAAGGGNDVMARIVAEKMSKTLGQNVVVENRAGAGGSIATRQVARAAPDGYTLVLGGTGTLAVNPTLYSNVGYDPRKDFAPVGLIGTGQLIVLVNPKVPAKTIPELIALAKKEPGKLSYASAGVGSGIHLGAVLFEQMADIKLTHVPYRGTAPALTDLIGGHVQIYFSSIALRDRHRQGGQGARAGGDRAEALAGVPRPADGAGGRAAGLRGRPSLWDRRACRHAKADRRQAQRGAAPSGDGARHQGSHGRRRHRAAALDARGVRRRHRQGRDQVVGDRAAFGSEGGLGQLIASLSLRHPSRPGRGRSRLRTLGHEAGRLRMTDREAAGRVTS